jgi:hypothetical protein
MDNKTPNIEKEREGVDIKVVRWGKTAKTLWGFCRSLKGC